MSSIANTVHLLAGRPIDVLAKGETLRTVAGSQQLGCAAHERRSVGVTGSSIAPDVYGGGLQALNWHRWPGSLLAAATTGAEAYEQERGQQCPWRLRPAGSPPPRWQAPQGRPCLCS